jgi:hypothetical protein
MDLGTFRSVPVRSRRGRSGDEELVVPFSRKKFGLLIGVFVVFAPLLVYALISDPRAAWGWIGCGFLLVMGFLLWRTARRGLLFGKPALVLSTEGLVDNQNAITLRWAEIERIEPREIYASGATITMLGIHPTDPEVVRRHMGSIKGGVADILGQAFDEAPIGVNLQFASASLDEVVAAIRRYWDGPIDGYDADFDEEFAARPRRSRLRRFLGWVLPWIVGFGVAALMLVGLVRCGYV